MGRAYRFPTVNELFQSLADAEQRADQQSQSPAGDLDLLDLTGEYRKVDAFNGAVGLFNPRVSLFLDDRWNAIVSQSSIGPTGQIITQNTNLDNARFRGVERRGHDEGHSHRLGWISRAASPSSTRKSCPTAMRSAFTGGMPAGSPLPDGRRHSALQGMQYPRVPRIRIRRV